MINAADLVSIVVPSYNYGAFLAEAIDSALAQTYRPIEVIVVDDGSTDETLEVARRYDVEVVAQTNQGLSAASNAGIARSSGTFVMRLDADDRLDPQYVEKTVAALHCNPNAHFAYTQVTYFGAQSGTYPVEEFDSDSIAERNYVNASAMMRRSSFDRVGGYRPNPERVRCEDWDLWLSFAERDMYGVLVPEPLLRYRRHAAGSMVNFNFLRLKDVRREILMASLLQDHHPALFAPRALLRRLSRLPGRITRREASIRFGCLLVLFYGVMLVRDVRSLAAGRAPLWRRANNA